MKADWFDGIGLVGAQTAMRLALLYSASPRRVQSVLEDARRAATSLRVYSGCVTRGRILKQLSVIRLFVVVVVIHFLINTIDQPSGMAGLANVLTTTSFVTGFLTVVRLATGAALVTDLLHWCAAWRRISTLWLLCTLAVLVQLIWHLSIGSVSTLLAVSSLISAASMFAAFLSGGVWLRQRISAVWR